jgi:hypothetical protein
VPVSNPEIFFRWLANQDWVDRENDLFFHLSNTIDEHGFRQGQEQQKLTVKFYDQPNDLIPHASRSRSLIWKRPAVPTKDARLDHHAVMK